MNRLALVALFALLPAVAGAQAIRCKDPATGKILYTDQPCKGGELVVPQRSEADIARDAANAAAAREREHDRAVQQREERALQREQLRAQQAALPPPAPPAETEACRAARAEAAFRAGSFSASAEEIRTARYNAALACGQQPPADIVVVQPQEPLYPVRRPPRFDDPRRPIARAMASACRGQRRARSTSRAPNPFRCWCGRRRRADSARVSAAACPWRHSPG